MIARIDALLAQAPRGRLVREGAQVAIVGAPNVGKSSLFNALLNTNRAIVTAIPGTTRDLLTERADIGGLSLSLVDTAGVRDTVDVVEQEGVARARGTLRVADLTIVVLDRSRPLHDRRSRAARRHGDAAARGGQEQDRPAAVAAARAARSGRSGRDLGDDRRGHRSIDRGDRDGAEYERAAARSARRSPTCVTPCCSNARAHRSTRAATALEGEVPEEFPLLDLQEAGAALQEITGRTHDATICCVTSSNASASASKSARFGRGSSGSPDRRGLRIDALAIRQSPIDNDPKSDSSVIRNSIAIVSIND